MRIERQNGKTDDLITTTFREHSSDKRTAIKELKMETAINSDKELSVKSINHTNNINVDKTNEYLYNFTLPNDELAIVEYAKIVQQHNMKGIAPELNLNAHAWYSQNIDKRIAKELGETSMAFVIPSRAFIGITPHIWSTHKIHTIGTLNHEAEHLLVQNRDIYRLIGDNASYYSIKWDDPRAKNFYEDAVKRFGKITSESKEYEEAKRFVEADKTYQIKDKKSYMENYLEVDADRPANKAKNKFKQAVDDVQNNFPFLKLPIENLNHVEKTKFQEKIMFSNT